MILLRSGTLLGRGLMSPFRPENPNLKWTDLRGSGRRVGPDKGCHGLTESP